MKHFAPRVGCWLTAVGALAGAGACRGGDLASAPAVPLAQESIGSRLTRQVSGWTLQINPVLLATNAAATSRALELLTRQLDAIIRRVPPAAVAELQKVTLYFSPEYPGQPPRAEYHPDADWLRAHGRNPAMAKGVEFTNLRIFAAETDRMPAFALHELAHAYHDRVLLQGFDNPEVVAAFERARASGKYDRVERYNGAGQPNTFERAYAMTNPQEFFAECSEAFYFRNDFFPFTPAELKQSDPETYALMEKLWHFREGPAKVNQGGVQK